MKVLIGGYLAKPLVVPLTKMIAEVAPVEFEAIGTWLSESDEIECDFPITPEEPFLFSLRRFRGKTASVEATELSRGRFPEPSLGRILATHGKSLMYETAYYLDAIIRRNRYRSFLSQFDLVHLHSAFLTLTGSRFENIDMRKPVVVTLWGSDVLRGTVNRIKRQQRLLERATLITCSTPEFKEVILAKFGRHLSPKLRETYFSIDNAFVNRIVATDKSAARKKFVSRYGVHEDAIIVCVGHNASPANQQIEVLKSLGRQVRALERPLFVVVPMTYCQTDKAHMDRVRNELKEQGLQGVVLTDFMDDESLGILRKATDVLIYAAISDVFSATISQGLIAGQVVITGAWLPNRARKQAGCVFWEIETAAEAGEKVVELCGARWEEVRKSTEINEEVGLRFFSSQRLGQTWHQVYQEAIRLAEGHE